MRRRPLLLLVGVLFAARLDAQGLVGGWAIDSASNAPLPCMNVALEDSSGRAVDETRTALDGAFQFAAPPRGLYRLRFSAWLGPSLEGPLEMIEPDTERAERYSLVFGNPTPLRTQKAPETAADAMAWPRVFRGPMYPPSLRDRMIEGEVSVLFVVDTLGRVSRDHIRVTYSTDQGFTAAVREYLTSAWFWPARQNHRRVCSLVFLPFEFRIHRQ